MSVSDELMWRYYLLLTDLAPAQIEQEKAKAQPMTSKLALARRLVADFHGENAALAADAEWRRVHQQRQAPSEAPVVRVPAGGYKPHELLATCGLAKSKSDAVRLLKQRAVKRDGAPIDGSNELRVTPGEGFVLSVGPARFVRVEAAEDQPPRT
jgi:tyrosyl-tRNA synthetase